MGILAFLNLIQPNEPEGFPSGLMVAYHLASGNFSYFAGYGSLVGGDTGQHPITLIIWLTDLPKKNKSENCYIWGYVNLISKRKTLTGEKPSCWLILLCLYISQYNDSVLPGSILGGGLELHHSVFSFICSKIFIKLIYRLTNFFHSRTSFAGSLQKKQVTCSNIGLNCDSGDPGFSLLFNQYSLLCVLLSDFWLTEM